MPDFRSESDLLGEKKIPEYAYYGVFTQRALENFNISGQQIHPSFIKYLALIKKAAAETNKILGYLDHILASAITRSADEVIEGKHTEEFKLDVFQAGAGTPWNMNMNEVLANLANETLGKPLGMYAPVHPNDHVNLMQSSNDVIPNTIRLTSIELIRELYKSLENLEQALTSKAEEFMNIKKSGRTHLRDAVPITIGQELKAYSKALKNARLQLSGADINLHQISLGGTAVGTGINTDPNYPKTMVDKLRKYTGYDLTQASDFIEKTQFMSDFKVIMDLLAGLAVVLLKICNDLMVLSSGPMTGLNEIHLPSVEPGSSIMPGKINPSILESVNMVCFQVIGNRAAVEQACSSGCLELNVYTPVIAFNLFNSISWLSKAIDNLRKRCIEGLGVNSEQVENYFKYSNAFVTLLSPIIGYDVASKLAVEAAYSRRPVIDLAVERGLLSVGEAKLLVDHSTEPNMIIIQEILKKRGRKD
ncbi:aspartate ammonia-lyase [Candidatus Bathyarchaeota archaeon]|nr:MAG: aspartate ammonia-lyase [Candidatus Bathyarchaeota archaeon]